MLYDRSLLVTHFKYSSVYMTISNSLTIPSLQQLQIFFDVDSSYFFSVLPLYSYQPISLHPRAHMLSHVIPWTSAGQTPLSMDFSRQEYWSGLPFPSPGDVDSF